MWQPAIRALVALPSLMSEACPCGRGLAMLATWVPRMVTWKRKPPQSLADDGDGKEYRRHGRMTTAEGTGCSSPAARGRPPFRRAREVGRHAPRNHLPRERIPESWRRDVFLLDELGEGHDDVTG